MLRLLVRFLVMVTVMAAGAFFFAQWKLKSDLKTFARQAQPFLNFEFDAASISLSGEIKINNINIFIESVGSRVEIREVNLFMGNIYQLAKMQAGLNSKKLPEKVYFKLKDVLVPLDSKVLLELNNDLPITGFDLLETAFCGPVQRFGLREYADMGYSLVSFSTDVSYLLDKYDGSLKVAGSFDFEDIYYSDFELTIGGVLSWYEEFSQQISGSAGSKNAYITPEISKLVVNVKDQGFHLRKAEYCSKQQESKIDYYSGHVNTVEKKLAEVGMILPEKAKLLYREAIQPDSKFQWSIEPKVNFDFKKAMNYEYEQLVDSSGLKLTVNDKPVDLMIDGWSFDKVLKIKSDTVLQQAQNEKNKETYQYKMVRQSFQPIKPNNIANYIKYRIKVERTDGQLFEGKLTKISRDNIWILIHSKNGELTLPIRRSEISRIEVYKETPEN